MRKAVRSSEVDVQATKQSDNKGVVDFFSWGSHFIFFNIPADICKYCIRTTKTRSIGRRLISN